MLNIAFTGGGTGGHIYPGLAVAEKLKTLLADREHRIFWIGSKAGRDRSVVEGSGLEFFGIPAGRLRRYFSLKTVPDTFRVFAGFFAALRVLKKQKADILFSKGGFVSVPPCAAAAFLGIPVFTHESDFSPGLATRLNLRFVRKTGGRVFTAYEDTARCFPAVVRDRVTVSGNPVRSAFRNADPEKGRAFLELAPEERVLFVLGGSQGAKEIHDLVRSCLDDLRRCYTVVHQTGPGQDDGLSREKGYIPLAYINEEMPHVLAAAELVLGRSGAGTVWEAAVSGKPMILIPLRGSGTRGDQVENAKFFEQAGAAVVLQGSDGDAASFAKTAKKLAQTVNGLAEDSGRREAMAKAAACIGALDGAGIIGDSVNNFLKEKLWK
jgi:UDP-N-acetylglucosamine--N-acetylmuramyl-(pentapeptide) pyrophosphoryl-undecaprenol N-acetylglucosamine transferase